jgi:phosphate uptake regulator
MRRKLVKQGAATMMISLPSKWIKENKLDKGDEVDLIEKNNNIIIGAALQEKIKKIELTVNFTTESVIRTVITNAYRVGFDSIKLNFNNEKTFAIIQEVVSKNLLGFEVIKKEDNFCIIENITEPAIDQFDNIFNKIMLNIEELISILENFDSNPKEFADDERQIQKFDNFCRRVISKKDFSYKSILNWTFHAHLIHGQREVYWLLRYLKLNKKKLDKNSFDLINELKITFAEIKKAYFKKDLSCLDKIQRDSQEIFYNKGYKYLNTSKDAIPINHLISAIRNFYLATGPLIGLVL